MDPATRAELVMRPPCEEVVPEGGLERLFETVSRPKHYVGLEISGRLHLGSLLSTGYKINDMAEAGIDCTVFLADWHTEINDKLGADSGRIALVSKYYERAFRAVCPGVGIRRGSELYDELGSRYWSDLVRFTKHASLARIRKTLTIMGRSEDDQKIDLAKMLYPPMQAVDIRSLDVDIAHAGMDQRKIHMLVRDVFPKLGWKVPVSVHHAILPSLLGPRGAAADGQAKMSKSDPRSGIFIGDTDEQISKKIRKAWCEEGSVADSPLMDVMRHILMREGGATIPLYKGGQLEYGSYEELEAGARAGDIHPGDLKEAVSAGLCGILAPLRQQLDPDEETLAAMGG